MRWQMNGKQLGNGGNYKTDNSGALEIKRLENPGEFKCIAENFLGKDGASSYINILGLYHYFTIIIRLQNGNHLSSLLANTGDTLIYLLALFV